MEPIFFHEHEFYPFSNFSAFMLEWKGKDWITSEHAYQSEKYEDETIKKEIRNARSAYGAWKIGQKYLDKRRPDWNEVKVAIMKDILRAKVAQHPYVEKKLRESKGRELIEDSCRDPFWGWGPNKDGKNQLGKIWMEVREELPNK